jgi:hypothetical protein
MFDRLHNLSDSNNWLLNPDQVIRVGSRDEAHILAVLLTFSLKELITKDWLHVVNHLLVIIFCDFLAVSN